MLVVVGTGRRTFADRELTFRCLTQPVTIAFGYDELNELRCNIGIRIGSNTEVTNVGISRTVGITRSENTVTKPVFSASSFEVVFSA